ncbi:C40 family peptidase [Streptosporangium sp. NPDC000396]|uniref:C40 family peptidase n=1 Tax=Streptosporangium sp. NPDC000396 TaxID=3366185 RepID=UPI0036B5EEE1
MEGITLSGKFYPRALSLLAAGTAVFSTPAVALAASPAPVTSPALTATPIPAPVPVTLDKPKLKEALTAATPMPAWQKAVKWAMSKRGTPYVWGGTGNGGFDCSGLMLRAYGAAGIKLPRVAADQYGAFSKKVPWKNLKPGDLVFFHGLGHVGMITRPGYMVHAPQSGDVVKEEKLNDWRRQTFVGAVRPDREGVKLSEQLKRAAESLPTTTTEVVQDKQEDPKDTP